MIAEGCGRLYYKAKVGGDRESETREYQDCEKSPLTIKQFRQGSFAIFYPRFSRLSLSPESRIAVSCFSRFTLCNFIPLLLLHAGVSTVQSGPSFVTRQSSGAAGASTGEEVAGDSCPQMTTMTITTPASSAAATPTESDATAPSAGTTDPPQPLQRRRWQRPQTASSAHTDEAQSSRISTSAILSLPDSPVRSATSASAATSNISKSQMKEFREAFRLFDKDGDGSITKEELGRVMRSLGQFARAEELRTMLQEIDIDGDGNVSFEEFVEIVSNIGANTAAPTDQDQEEQELRDAFRVFDKHNRGYITASDLRAVLQCLGEDLSEEEIEDMIKEVDVDGDGRIDFYEFVHALGEPGIDEDEEDEEEELLSPA
ncbi:uncharacterized protein [Prorops nasuta]|uniref:uncharacterized protein n=1 Tax=Prorops nasuta TaxID=863751 RepID=UPI0034CED571